MTGLNYNLLQIKIGNFLELLKDLQNKQEYLKLDELVWYIYEKTGYYSYATLMPNGELRIANLKKLFEKAKEYEKASFKGLYNFIGYLDKVSKGSQDVSGVAKLIGENENAIRIMSIHKSKGLEFPVVFLCGTGKQFNMQDLNQNILLHQDIGFGPKYISYERKIEYSTLAKEAIRIKLKNEILSEEMRLLYVALTRSKEKLIISGVTKSIPISSLKNAKSYLDWLEFVIEHSKKDISDVLDIFYYKRSQFFEESSKLIAEDSQRDSSRNNKEEKNIEKKTFKEIMNGADGYIYEDSPISEIFNWRYPNEELTKVKGKTSVTDIVDNVEKQHIDIAKKPKFLKDKIQLTRAEIGTITHLILQKLDFKLTYNEKMIKDLISNTVIKEIITQKESEVVDINKIMEFTKSKLYSKIQNAKKIFKEQPFYINIPSKELGENNFDENILVQGIIDLYFIDENDNIILVDYKTDYLEKGNEQELIEKYKKQLNIYRKAIEQATSKNVREVYIYSIHLEKEIALQN